MLVPHYVMTVVSVQSIIATGNPHKSLAVLRNVNRNGNTEDLLELKIIGRSGRRLSKDLRSEAKIKKQESERLFHDGSLF